MYYGVEQSTDLRNRQTVIKKFTSLPALKRWMKNSGEFTYKDPKSARNWHHTYRYGYKLFGRVNKKDPVFADFGTSTYPQGYNEQLAQYLYKTAEEVDQ